MAAPVIIVDPGADAAAGFASGLECAEEDAFVFEAAPWPLDEDIVHPAAAPVHRDVDAAAGRDRCGAADATPSGAGHTTAFP